MARGEPRNRDGACGRFSQEGHRPPESDVAGVDGVRRTIDAQAYTIRFTPRKPGSTWSNANIERVGELTALGLMQPAGLAAFERRKEAKSGIYTYERSEPVELGEDELREFQASEDAWTFFESQPPWYRRTASGWVMSAKRDETRRRRLTTLIEDSEKGQRIGPLSYGRVDPVR